MKLFYWLFLVEQMVWVPIVIGLFRFKNLTPTYLPLFIYLLVRSLLELGANLTAIYSVTKNNALFYNLLYLSEALLITWQLYQMEAFKNQLRLYQVFQVGWLVLWLTDVLVLGSPYEFNLLNHVVYSFILMLTAARLISRLAITIRHSLYHNTAFCLCIVFCIWFVYSVLYAFAIYLLPLESDLWNLSLRIIQFWEYFEALVYLVYAWILYRIPARRSFYFHQQPPFL